MEDTSNKVALALQAEKQSPRNVTIEVGKWYFMTSGSKVQVLALRTNGESINVYYRYPNGGSIFSRKYSHNYMSLDSFKSGLRDLGSFDKLTVTPYSTVN